MAKKKVKRKRSKTRAGLPAKVFAKRNRLRKARMKRIEKLRPKLILEYSRLAGGSLNPKLLKTKTYKV